MNVFINGRALNNNKEFFIENGVLYFAFAIKGYPDADIIRTDIYDEGVLIEQKVFIAKRTAANDPFEHESFTSERFRR